MAQRYAQPTYVHHLGAYFDDETEEALREIAAADRKSMSKVLRRIVDEHPTVRTVKRRLAAEKAAAQKSAGSVEAADDPL